MSQQYPGPGQHPTQPTNPYGQPYQPPAPRPLHKMKRVWAGGLGLLLIGTGCGAMGGDNGATSPAAAAKPAPTVTVTATVTAQPDAPVEKPAAAKPTAAKTPAPAAPAPAPAVETAQLPNFVGMNHQDAQDTAQAAGFWSLREKDATGMERLLVLDRNWKVCKQEPAPGRHGVEKTITLYSVKESEPC